MTWIVSAISRVGSGGAKGMVVGKGSTGLWDLPGNGLPVSQGSLPSLVSGEGWKHLRGEE